MVLGAALRSGDDATLQYGMTGARLIFSPLSPLVRQPRRAPAARRPSSPARRRVRQEGA